jgi:hypothetical protein
VSTKPGLGRVAEDEVDGPAGCLGCGMSGVGCTGGRGDETTGKAVTLLGREATVGGDSERGGKM